MVGCSRQGLPSWIGVVTATRMELNKNKENEESPGREASNTQISDADLSFSERAFSAAGAALISSIVVNPFDIAKTRLQAQAAGVPYNGLCPVTCVDASSMLHDLKYEAQATCSQDCARYKGTLDVFYKVARQEGISRLWRGTNAGLALAIPTVGIYMPLYDIFRNYLEGLMPQSSLIMMPYVPLVAGSFARSVACIICYPVELARTRMQAFTQIQTGAKPPGVWRTLVDAVSHVKSVHNPQPFQSYRVLWTGLGAQLARDVPFSGICWSFLEPLRRRNLGMLGDDSSVSHLLGVNFCSGFVAGSIASLVTCPLDVARTRRQIEKDPARAFSMTTRQTLIEIWRDGGVKGLFTGASARVGRAGPSVGIVVSFYEVAKLILHS